MPIGEVLSYIGTYQVSVVRNTGQLDSATLKPAEAKDMLFPSLTFQWQQIWQQTWFGWEGIVKLTYDNHSMGLMQFAIQPEAEPEDDQLIPVKQPGFLEVIFLEAVKNTEERLIDPIGKWLLWYAVQVAFEYCEGSRNGSILGLLSKPEACSYYGDKIGMEYGNFTITPQGSNTTPFKFNREQAEQFCEQLYAEYGYPERIDE